jgi:hypothetical protein
MSNTNSSTVVPVVGMGATVHGYSDSRAYTVVKVSASGKKVTLQRDKAALLNGVNSGEQDALQFSPGGFCGHTSGTQRYSYEKDTNGQTLSATFRKNGKWVVSGTTSERVSLDKRSEHYDFNF